MKTVKNRFLIVGIVLLLGSIGGYVLTPKANVSNQLPKIDLNTAIPMEFSGWKMQASINPVELTPAAKKMLEETYDEILNRTYTNVDGKKIMLSIAYGSKQNQALKAHRQEVCYAAQGFKIEDLHVENVKVANQLISVTRMYAISKERKEPVTYWFTVGDTVVQSRGERLLAQIKYSFSGLVPDGFLVRISDLSENKDASYVKHVEFANELLAKISPENRQRLIGAL